MVLPGLPVGLALLRHLIGAFAIAIVTTAAYKKPTTNVPLCLGTYSYLGAQYRLPY